MERRLKSDDCRYFVLLDYNGVNPLEKWVLSVEHWNSGYEEWTFATFEQAQSC